MKKHVPVSVIIFFCVLNSFCMSQNAVIDTLSLMLKTAKHDTSMAAIYVELSENLYAYNPDTVIPLSNKVLELCEKNLAKAKREEKRSFLTSKAAALNNIGYVHMNKGRYDKALEYYNLSLQIRQDINDKSGVANCLNNMGLVYDSQGLMEKSLEHYMKSSEIREKIGDRRGNANVINNIGLVYSRQGLMVKALEWYLKALAVWEEFGDKAGTAVSLQNVAYIYQTQGDNEKALEYAIKSLRLRQEINNKQEIAYSLNMIGFIHSFKPPYDTALKYYSDAYKIREEVGDRRGMATSLNNIGSMYGKLGQNQKALEYYLKTHAIRKEIGDITGMAYSLRNIAAVYFEEKDYKKAEESAREGMKHSQQTGNVECIRDISALLSKLYNVTGKYKQAYEMHVLYKQMADSVSNVQTKKSTVKKQMQYDFERKQIADSIKTAEKINQKNLKHAQQIQQQKIYTYGGIIGFALMMIVAGVSFSAYRQKQKANQIISHQKIIVEEKQKEILDSIQYAKRIQQSLLPSDKYLSRHIQARNKK